MSHSRGLSRSLGCLLKWNRQFKPIDYDARLIDCHLPHPQTFTLNAKLYPPTTRG